MLVTILTTRPVPQSFLSTEELVYLLLEDAEGDESAALLTARELAACEALTYAERNGYTAAAFVLAHFVSHPRRSVA